MAPRTALRDPERIWELRFLVTAEKDGDVAYVGSDWTEGIEPWNFGICVDLDGGAAAAARVRLQPTAACTASARRCTSRPSCAATPRRGCALLDRGHGGRGRRPRQPGRGARQAHAAALGMEQRGLDVSPARRGAARELRGARDGGRAEVARSPGSFLVAAYRRPDFRVDANLAGESSLAGDQAQGRRHRPLPLRRAHGRPRRALDVLARRRSTTVPAAVTDALPAGPLRLPRRGARGPGRSRRGDAARPRGQARRAGPDRARPRTRT